jgi:hypothetical protein
MIEASTTILQTVAATTLGVASQVPNIHQVVVEFGRALMRDLFDRYRPEMHYMRGPGPRWHQKHGTMPRSLLNLSDQGADGPTNASSAKIAPRDSDVRRDNRYSAARSSAASVAPACMVSARMPCPGDCRRAWSELRCASCRGYGPCSLQCFAASTRKVTLLFGAHDTEHNNAVALADYLAVP